MAYPPTRRISFLERTLFSFTRVFVTVGSLVSVGGFVMGILMYLSIGGEDTHVGHDEVKRALSPPVPTSFASLQAAVPEVTIPSNVDKYMGRDDRKVFLGWIEDLDEAQKKDFISNLSEVIAEAEKQSDDVVDVINKYSKLKLPKLRGNVLDKYATRAAKAGAIGFTLAMAMLAAIMSLVLVLLAIERNTRSSFAADDRDVGTA